jgi:hypothetical protein
MRIFDMAPSRAKPYRVTLDDAERNRKFPCHADQGIAFEIRGPKHRRVGKAQRAHHLSTSHGVSGGHAFALHILRSLLNSQQVDVWTFVESDYEYLRVHELRESTKDVRPSPCYSQGQSGNTDLSHIKSQSNNLTS